MIYITPIEALGGRRIMCNTDPTVNIRKKQTVIETSQARLMKALMSQSIVNPWGM